MKTLLLLRHAKSSWNDPSLPDRDRLLNARGEHDAATMSKRLSKRHLRPELIISSPAARALATATIIANGLDYRPKHIVVNDRLYAASVDALIAAIEALDDAWHCVMLVGHNPEFTELAHHFASEISHMPTCAVAEFEFATGRWQGVGHSRPVNTAFDWPKHAPD